MGVWWNGRHEGLRSLYRKMCRFESCLAHQLMNKEIRDWLMDLDIKPMFREYMLDYIIKDDFYKICIVNTDDDSPADDSVSRRRR